MEECGGSSEEKEKGEEEDNCEVVGRFNSGGVKVGGEKGGELGLYTTKENPQILKLEIFPSSP